ncbi:MAG TPA: PqqD family protein [Acidimicrobiales bacterium]|nr:PqqD family protein [Acidimicrobiales bacterium]
MTDGECWARADAALFRRCWGTVLVRLPDGPVHTLTGTASEIWELLARRSTVAELVHALSHRYDAVPDVIGPDVARFIETLSAAGVVAAGPGPSTASPVA